MIALCTPMSLAASGKTKKMTAYRCLKSKDTVYCCARWHLYKVNLNNEKVIKLKTPKYLAPHALKLKGHYLYCSTSGHSYDSSSIIRIDLNTNKYKTLAKAKGETYADNNFVIKGSKIYYSTFKIKKNGNLKYFKKSMKLNGKSKKASKYKAKMKVKETNNDDYWIWSDDSYDSDHPFKPIDYYLHTPGGDIYIGAEEI